jgi:hypothetical protein
MYLWMVHMNIVPQLEAVSLVKKKIRQVITNMGFEVSESESEKCCRFEVLTVEGIKITVSWYVAPCGFVDTYQCFE